jgi:LmbE family N-acetylglucosaminyl deacetylase
MPLRLHNPGAEVFVPDGRAPDDALARVTHVGIGAHADDLELMAFHGIAHCLATPGCWFGGVVCSDGARAPRTGRFAGLGDAELRELRRAEQRAAAARGRYAAVAQLDYPSPALLAGDASLVDDLFAFLDATRPRVVYTHEPADRHASHVATCAAAIAALRRLPAEWRPARVLGCEVWRSLDWLAEGDLVRLDVSGHDETWRALLGCFASQIEGARPFDAGALGRARANAVFSEARAAGGGGGVWLAIDLTPLVRDPQLSLDAFVRERIARFAAEAASRDAGAADRARSPRSSGTR